MSEAQPLSTEMEHAYQRGDHLSARSQARAVLDQPSASVDSEQQSAARELLRRTEPDAFLMAVGALGLGLMVWLVYTYIL